jgi:hypothetical protein
MPDDGAGIDRGAGARGGAPREIVEERREIVEERPASDDGGGRERLFDRESRRRDARVADESDDVAGRRR